jgi:hypothetical protein
LLERRNLERRLIDFTLRGDLAMSQAAAPVARDGAGTGSGGNQ